MSDPYAAYRDVPGGEVPRQRTRMDEHCEQFGMTYAELAQELDDAADLPMDEVSFVADCIDQPERITTERQLWYLRLLYERRCT